jgi:TPR repeat protein
MAQKVLAYYYRDGLLGFNVDPEQERKWSDLARRQGMQV